MEKFKQLLIEIRVDQAGLRFFVNIQPMGVGGVQGQLSSYDRSILRREKK